MCIPPKKGGKPCTGKSVLTRDCNKKACPNTIEINEATPDLPPMIKVAKISERF